MLVYETRKRRIGRIHQLCPTTTGELAGVDNLTYQKRLFTVYKRSGSFLIVSDNGQERLAGPDSGLKKADLLREVMDQFQVHALRVKSSIASELRAGQG